MKLYLNPNQTSYLNEIISTTALTAQKANDGQVAKILSELAKKITPKHSYVKLKAYEAEYVLDYVEATRAALDEALVTLATDEREEKDRLVTKATGMRDELETVSALIRSKGILTQAEKEVEYNRSMNKDIEAAISYEPEIEDV
jgi:hypothetical protein